MCPHKLLNQYVFAVTSVDITDGEEYCCSEELERNNLQWGSVWKPKVPYLSDDCLFVCFRLLKVYWVPSATDHSMAFKIRDAMCAWILRGERTLMDDCEHISLIEHGLTRYMLDSNATSNYFGEPLVSLSVMDALRMKDNLSLSDYVRQALKVSSSRESNVELVYLCAIYFAQSFNHIWGNASPYQVFDLELTRPTGLEENIRLSTVLGI